MHVGIVHGYDNILYHEDVVSYYYRIRRLILCLPQKASVLR